VFCSSCKWHRTLPPLPVMTFFTSSMSCHTSEWLAWALVLLVFTVLVVGLVSTSIGKEAEAPNGGTSVAASPGLGSATGVGVGGDPELMCWLRRGGVDRSVVEESRTQRGSTVDRSHGHRRR
jgi:hypothetical protein